jgi:hypothetical protein
MSRRKLFMRKKGGFEPEYQAVLDEATALGYTLPSSTQSNINNKIIKYLKAEGIWTGLSVFWYAKQESGLADFATLNWVDPIVFQLNQSNGTLKPPFVANNGFRGGNGSGEKYFNAGWIPRSDSNIGSTNISCFYKCFDTPSTFTVTSYVAGTRTGNDKSQILISNSSNNSMLFRLFTAQGAQSYNQNIQDNHAFIINDGTNPYNIYNNGVFNTTFNITTGSSLMSNLELTFLGLNNNGTKAGTNNNIGVSYLAFGNATDLSGKQVEIYEIMEGLYIP